MLTLERFSFGVGDRFAHQAKAQLAAFQKLEKAGIQSRPSGTSRIANTRSSVQSHKASSTQHKRPSRKWAGIKAGTLMPTIST